jgi:hypothetical protein
MTMSLFDKSFEYKGSEFLHEMDLYSTNPGEVLFDSSDDSVIEIVTTSLTVPGTKTWKGRHTSHSDGFHAPQECANLCAARMGGISLLFELDCSDLPPRESQQFNARYIPFGMCYKDTARRIAWGVGLYHYSENSIYPRFFMSPDASSNENAWTNLPSYFAPPSGVIRFVIRLFATGISHNIRVWTTYGNQSFSGASVWVDDFTDCYLLLSNFIKFARYGFELTDEQTADWIADGIFPAGSTVNYLVNEEEGCRAYDYSGNNYDSEVDIEPIYGRNRIFREGAEDVLDPVIKQNKYTIIVKGVGTATIRARRRKQGVPDRAPDNEKYEEVFSTVIVSSTSPVIKVGPVQTVVGRLLDNPKAYCHITADREGTVNITCDRTIIDFPLTAVIGPTLETTIEGDILQSGDCDVTAVMV